MKVHFLLLKMVGSDCIPISNGFDVRLGGEMGTIFPYNIQRNYSYSPHT